MTRRTKWGVGLGVLVAVAGLAVVLWPDAGPRPCRTTFERVTVGMTPEGVNATVGGPPGYYARGAVVSRDEPGAPVQPRPCRWTADDGELQVGFGQDGKVAVVFVATVVPKPRYAPLLQRLLHWVGP